MNKTYFVGNKFTGSCGYECTIIGFSDNYRKVIVQFEHGEVREVDKCVLKHHRFSSKLKKSVYGIGIYVPTDKYSCRGPDGKVTRAYNYWANMLKRAYCNSAIEEEPCYTNVSVTEPWHSSDVFWAWAEKQVGWLLDGYHFDKDLLVHDNKIYCPECCVFIPHKLNSFLVDTRKVRSLFGQGVMFDGNKYVAHISDNGRTRAIGKFSLLSDAKEAYKEEKTKIARRWASQIKSGDVLVDLRVLERLETFEFIEKEREDVYDKNIVH